MQNKILRIGLNLIPVVVMIALIPFVKNDWLLLAVYLIIIAIALVIRIEKKEAQILLFGLVLMTLAEIFFVKTTVEFFIRDSLFGLMPVWLPLLWAYGFVVIKRSTLILLED
jgi:hypothetical protein